MDTGLWQYTSHVFTMQIRGNSVRSLAFSRNGSASTAFTDALEELDSASEASTPLQGAALQPDIPPVILGTDEKAAAHVSPAVPASPSAVGAADGQPGETPQRRLTAQTSLARQRALEWEQRMKVRTLRADCKAVSSFGNWTVRDTQGTAQRKLLTMLLTSMPFSATVGSASLRLWARPDYITSKSRK